MIKIYEFGAECFFMEPNHKKMYVTIERGNFQISFEKLDNMIKYYKTNNRIHKPIFLLLYIDYKNNKLKQNEWKYIETDYSTEFLNMIKTFEVW